MTNCMKWVSNADSIRIPCWTILIPMHIDTPNTHTHHSSHPIRMHIKCSISFVLMHTPRVYIYYAENLVLHENEIIVKRWPETETIYECLNVYESCFKLIGFKQNNLILLFQTFKSERKVLVLTRRIWSWECYEMT